MKKLFGDLVNVVKEKDKQLENVVKKNTELTKKNCRNETFYG